MLRMAIGLTAVLCTVAGADSATNGLSTLKHQRQLKIAGDGAHWDGSKSRRLHIFAWPDQKA